MTAILPFPSKSQSNPVFPMPSSPSIVPPPYACSLQHAPTHYSLPSHHHHPPTHPVSPHRCSLTSPPRAPTPRTHSSSLATPRYATALPRPRPLPRDCCSHTTTTAAAACRSFDPRPDHAALCCVSRKRPLRIRRYRPAWCCCAVGCATPLVPRPPYIGSVKTGP